MTTKPKRPELLAPAGEPDSGYAALEYGADALYLGLNRFSARAEAVNFTPDDLADLAGYAHSLTPRRNIYLTLNTLVQQSELADAAATLLAAVECGADAVIVQDFGVAKLVRERFPSLKLHASTQMAIHSLEGALAAKALGYGRVTLARELTFGEIKNLVAGVGPDLEVETFIHGTLCYSYSGLCLFSSIMSGRSGNRGRCIYSCREAADTPAGRAHPFSLKDMALGERILDLAAIGVASLKIEGRKKSPLYVAATVDHYRRILDGKMSGPEIIDNEARLKTIFARPWTRFFLDSKRNPAAADPDVVGHRGSRIGAVDRLVRTPAGRGIAFTPSLPVERHDGLQVDIPGEARPFGFGVDSLFAVKGSRMESVFEAPAGSPLAVPLPDGAPDLSPGLPLYLSSSQAVKRAFPFSRPKPGAFAGKSAISVEAAIVPLTDSDDGQATIRCTVTMKAPGYWRGAAGDAGAAPLVCSGEERVGIYEARDAAGPEKAARAAFERLGDSPFRLEDWRFANPAGLFARPGDWNRLRRRLIAELVTVREGKVQAICEGMATALNSPAPGEQAAGDDTVFAWSVFVDDSGFLSSFTSEDFAHCREVTVNVGYGDAREVAESIANLADRVGREKIRLAVPLLLREDAVPAVSSSCGVLLDAGWRKWMVSGLAGWQLLHSREIGFGKASQSECQDCAFQLRQNQFALDMLPHSGLDLAADWTLFTLNRLSCERLAEMGVGAFTMSPEDDAGNIAALSARFGDRGTLVVFSHLPLFISAACAHSHIGLCNRKGHGCEVSEGSVLKMTLERGAKVEIIPQKCGSVVVEENYYSLAPCLHKLSKIGVKNVRMDFRWRNYLPDEVMTIWRLGRSGNLPGGINGNFNAKLL